MREFVITRQMDFCYGHRLLNHPGKCRFLHGHNGHVEISIQAEELNPDGMVMDFGDVRASIEAWIERELDHHTLLSRKDPLTDLLIQAGQPIVVLDENPTAENIARLILEQGRSMGLNIRSVRVWETSRCAAECRMG